MKFKDFKCTLWSKTYCI